MMKKMIIGAGVAVTGLVAARRFGPRLAERDMRKCHEMFDRESRPPEDRISAAVSGPRETRQACAS